MSLVTEIDEWPSRFDTSAMSAPLASSSDACMCRSPCSVISGRSTSSNSGAETVAEVRGRVFDRLADLGVEAAASVRAVEQQNAPAIAWYQAMTETAAGSDASVAAWQDVYRADPEGYEVVRAGFDGQVDDWARRLDRALA